MNGIPHLSERPTVEPRWLMPTVDFALVILAFMVGYIIRYEWQVPTPIYDPGSKSFLPYIPYMLINGALLLLNYQSTGLYRNYRGRTWTEETTMIASGVANATLIILALYFVFQPLVTSRLMLFYVALLSIGFMSTARIVRRIVLARLRKRGVGVQRVLIIGMGETGQAVLRTLVSRQELGYQVVGYVDDNPKIGEVDLGRMAGLGKIENLSELIDQHHVEIVIITLPWEHYKTIMELSRVARDHKTEVRVVPDIFQLNMRQVQVESLDGIPLLGIQGVPAIQGANRLMKRVMDVILTLLAAPLWLPLIGMVALAIKLDDGGDIFYHPVRVGENGRKFNMVKFRSMIPNAEKMRTQLMEAAGEDLKRPKIEDDPRITRVGKIIRRYSLDELPNFFNVLRGEMSLVGPRPPIPDEVDLYESWHLQRLQTIPGITGLWQISGRSEIPFDEMVLMDIYYIENWSVKFDFQILLMTVPRVLLRTGAY